mmetsp:Transcript_12240/g.23133  ORF Transcript_12240/g.23133 Transcript_12240/m.23133 type:complete len:252 (+) Transcript_12240:181-936(+)
MAHEVLRLARHRTAVFLLDAKFSAILADARSLCGTANNRTWFFGTPFRSQAAFARRRAVAGVLSGAAVHWAAISQGCAGDVLTADTSDLAAAAWLRTRIMRAPVHCNAVGTRSCSRAVANMLFFAAVRRASFCAVVAALLHLVSARACHFVLRAIQRARRRGAPVRPHVCLANGRNMAFELLLLTLHRTALGLRHASPSSVLLQASHRGSIAQHGAWHRRAPVHRGAAKRVSWQVTLMLLLRAIHRAALAA